jgi:dipeptidyl aminopeptidase/acylaminoacyl peptidase
VSFVDASDPPTLLIHGERDRIVPVEQSRSFHKALKAKGVKVELVEIPDVDHSFIGATQEATRKASLEALDKTFEFIDRTIGQDNKR